jgi:hypothetical protein
MFISCYICVLKINKKKSVMVSENLVLGVTDTDVLVNLLDYVGVGEIKVFLPNGDTYRGHYRDRVLPSINVILLGEVPLDGLRLEFSSSGTTVNGEILGLRLILIQNPEGGRMYSFKTSSVSSGWYGGQVGTDSK